MRFSNYGSAYPEEERKEEQFEVGDLVWFKVDYEGCGEIIRIEEKYRSNGFERWASKTYFIASPSEPAGYRWHQAAQMDYESKRMCVIIEDGYRMSKA